jgi:hypothetical protein
MAEKSYRRNRIPKFRDEDEKAVRDGIRYYFLNMLTTAGYQVYILLAIAVLNLASLIFLIAIFLKK